MRDDAFDLISLIVLVGMLISLGFMLVAKENRVTAMYNQKLYEDKNVQMVQGVVIPVYGDYDGTLTPGDVILMSQIQDWYMPSPKKLIIEDGGIVDVISTVEAERATYGANMVKYVLASGGKRFGLVYDNGKDLTDKDDDFFFIEKKR